MASTPTTLLCLLVFLCFVTNGCGSGECNKSSVEILEYPTLRRLKSEAEWQVYITNRCNCTIYELKLTCPDFRPGGRINPSIISKIEGSNHEYLVNNGNAVHPHTTIDFAYVYPDKLKPCGFAPFTFTQASS